MSFLVNSAIFGSGGPPPPSGDPSAPFWRSTGTGTSGIGPLTVTVPSFYAADDIFLLLVETENQPVAAPSGYTEASFSPVTVGSAGAADAVGLQVFWKRASGSESSVSVADSGDHTAAIIIAIGGCITSGNPIGGSGTGTTTPAATSFSWASATTAQNDSAVMFIGAHDISTTNTDRFSDPVNTAVNFITDMGGVGSTSGDGGGAQGFFSVRRTAGAIGTSTGAIAVAAVMAYATFELKGEGNGYPSLYEGGTLTGGVGNITPPLPANVAENDILLLICETANETVTAPSGYAQIEQTGTGTPGDIAATGLAVFYKRAGASESAPTVTDPGNHSIAQILGISGCITTGSPVDVSTADVEASSTTSITFPSVTTATDDAMVLQIVATGTDSNTPQLTASTISSGLRFGRVAVNQCSNLGGGGGYAVIAGIKQTAGAVGTSTGTLASAHAQARVTLALKPVP